MKTKIWKKDSIPHTRGNNNKNSCLEQIAPDKFINDDFKRYLSYTLLYMKAVDTLKVGFL